MLNMNEQQIQSKESVHKRTRMFFFLVVLGEQVPRLFVANKVAINYHNDVKYINLFYSITYFTMRLSGTLAKLSSV